METKTSTVIAEPIYHGNENFKSIALTCNVFWGEEYIGRMLEILEEKDVKATFYIGGTWAEKFPDLVKKINEKGHEIGSHGYSHPHPDQLSVDGNKKDISRAEEIIRELTGERPKLYAPPYGERGPALLQAAGELGYQTVLWSIDTIDWQLPDPGVIKERVISKAHNGGIVLMHPTAPTVKALPEIIDTLRERGYQIVTVGEMLKTP
ncbi:polysaccharide deacetylase family protein [Desulfotruncus alcoholivorax]|uniref:polysaccharide deacetylase family protein n=1 Tax=Desulfotruncus alcoholivorax TaxID=265477 RepID=UPI0009D7854A|nr:polysaccharide deacetylase family protein [Desulfotruncus alcoholivorax]